jgi:quercetin dioxygenase-like cupin family protein
MHASGRIDEIPTVLGAYEGRSAGLARRSVVGRSTGSVHQEVAISSLEPGGRVERHLHAFEEGLYVLEGALELSVGGRTEALAADDFCWAAVGVAHELRNSSGSPARWLEVSAPQPGAGGIDDTVFVDESFAGEDGFRRGHFDEGDLPEPSGDILEGFGAAFVGGASLKMLIDPDFGATQFNLFTVRYVPGGLITMHDHAFEEAYVYVAGEIEGDLEGEVRTLAAGDWCWTSVGGRHAFTNRSSSPVRWLETQAPQPPRRHQARFFAEWDGFLGR